MRAAALAAALALGACAAAGPPAPPTAPERAAATAYLRALPPLPAGWRAGRFEAAPGVALETGRLAARGPRRGTVVFVPGYTAPLELYAREFERLAAAGWDVAALSPRGQGRSGGAAPGRGGTGYDDLTNDLAAFVGEQRGPVAVVAVSMGAHVALRLAAERRADLAAVAALVPMVAIRTGPAPRPLVRALAGAAVGLGAGGRAVPGSGRWSGASFFDDPARAARTTPCNDDPARAHLRTALATVDPALDVAPPTYRFVAETLASGRRLERLAPRIEAPLLVVTAGEDQVVDTEAAARLCDAVAACTRRHLPDAPHCAVEGDPPEAAAITGAVAAFLAGAAR